MPNGFLFIFFFPSKFEHSNSNKAEWLPKRILPNGFLLSRARKFRFNNVENANWYEENILMRLMKTHTTRKKRVENRNLSSYHPITIRSLVYKQFDLVVSLAYLFVLLHFAVATTCQMARTFQICTVKMMMGNLLRRIACFIIRHESNFVAVCLCSRLTKFSQRMR